MVEYGIDIMLSFENKFFILSVIMLSVIILSVVAPDISGQGVPLCPTFVDKGRSLPSEWSPTSLGCNL
jgi:hypothetical protein